MGGKTPGLHLQRDTNVLIVILISPDTIISKVIFLLTAKRNRIIVPHVIPASGDYMISNAILSYILANGLMYVLNVIEALPEEMH